MITKLVQSQDTMEFTANYNLADFTSLYNSSYEKNPTDDGNTYYNLKFGDENGSQGNFTWKGWHSVHVTGAGVNEVREMVITCIPKTNIVKVASSGGGGNSTP